MLPLLLTLAVGFVSASDLSCTLQGGTCLDYRYYICHAGYETGLCDGDNNRRCCLNCNNDCQSDDQYYNGCCDSACTSLGGDCFDNSNYCDGHYQSGKCGGPAERQCCVSSSGSGYGNIDNVDTTGASAQTAAQDNLSGGVSSSRKMAANDLQNMAQWKTWIFQAGADLNMDPAVIAGIMSRETRAGAVLGSDGFGGDGHGYGLMQVDDRYHTLEGGPRSYENIHQGTRILIDMIEGVKRKHPTWTVDMALKGGICAYNSGVSNVVTYENMDQGTTGHDYSNDVTARSQYYNDNGY